MFQQQQEMSRQFQDQLKNQQQQFRMMCQMFTTDQKLLAVPKSRLKTYGDRAFSVAAPKLWNELPLDLRSLVTINLFKKHLKTDLFKKAYNV